MRDLHIMFSRTSLDKLLNNGHVQNIMKVNYAKNGAAMLKIWAFECSGLTGFCK